MGRMLSSSRNDKKKKKNTIQIIKVVLLTTKLLYDFRRLVLLLYRLLLSCVNGAFLSLLELDSLYMLLYNRALQDILPQICFCSPEESRTGLERHEGEKMMTEHSFFDELPL